ncbi:MAG: argininosuccinate synthase [Candidatus Omnitrophota bacterium]|nr:MAG: argininosuccinate synthase [Candidatus Omnitrophota bacterium]
MSKKIVLAYSGGLDTSCCIAYLLEKGYEVVCFSANLGSEFSPSDLKKRAIASGASKIYIKDLRWEFAKQFVLPSLKANAVYEGKYVLSTALGRPLIAKYLVEVAKKEKANVIAHGCTAKGNDQVRFDTTVKILNPRIKIVAPLREWHLTSRESELEYAKSKKLPITATKEKIYSIDKNIWGVSIEAGILENLNNEPKDDAYFMTQSLLKAPNKPEYINITFEKGIPAALNNKKMDLVSLIEKLNQIGGRHGIGRTDLIEDRTVGIKSREVYEAPAAWVLIAAHKELESLVLDKETLYFKEIVGLKYAQLVYQGLWFSKLRESLDAVVQNTQEPVSGKITLKLYKGNIIIAKRNSKNSLYKKELATYGKKDKFDKTSAEGFINIFSMPFVR